MRHTEDIIQYYSRGYTQDRYYCIGFRLNKYVLYILAYTEQPRMATH